MKIDCTLDSLLLPALGTYSNEFGTKKLKGGLSTKECCDDTMLPFRKMRPYEVNEDSETTEIQHNAVFVIKSPGVTLTLHDSSEDFLGCEARVINVSDGAVTVKGGVSGLDGGIDGIEIPAKREETFIFLSDGWHSMFSGYKNVITQEIADEAVTNSKIADEAVTNSKIADEAVTNSKIADGTVEAEKLAISVFNMNYPIGFTYTQYPQQASPNELWGKFSTWEVVSYDGAFFRAAGGNADAFIEKTDVLTKQEELVGSFTITGGNHKHNIRVRNDGFPNDWEDYTTDWKSQYWHTSYNNITQKYNLNPESLYSGDLTFTRTATENRPENYTFRIWKRTA